MNEKNIVKVDSAVLASYVSSLHRRCGLLEGVLLGLTLQELPERTKNIIEEALDDTQNISFPEDLFINETKD